MTRLFIIAAALLFSATAAAQNQTSSDEGATSGGYGGMDLKVTSFDGEGAGVFGARGAWIRNHSLAIGGAGYGFSTDDFDHASDSELIGDQRLEGGYGGVLIEWYYKPDQPVHFTAGVIVGGGWIGRVSGSHEDDTHVVLDESGFFVTEPMIGVSGNVASLVRLALEGSYRFVVGSDLVGYDDGDLSSFAVGLSLKIGVF